MNDRVNVVVRLEAFNITLEDLACFGKAVDRLAKEFTYGDAEDISDQSANTIAELVEVEVF